MRGLIAVSCFIFLSFSSGYSHYFHDYYDLFPRLLRFISIITISNPLFNKPIFIVCFFLLLETLALTGGPIEPPNHPPTYHQTSSHSPHTDQPTAFIQPTPPTHLPPHSHHLVNDPGTTARCTVRLRLYQGFNFQPFSHPCRL